MSLIIPPSLLKEFTELKDKRDALVAELDALNTEYNEVKKLIDPIKEQREKQERIDKELKQKQEDLTLLSAQLKEQEDRIDVKLATVTQKEAQAKDLDKSIIEALSRQLILLNENEEITGQIAAKRKEYGDILAQIKRNNQQQAEIKEAQAKLNETKTQIEHKTYVLANATASNQKKLDEIYLTKRPITYYITALQKEIDRKKIDIKVMDLLNKLKDV